jgi:hypothetical protein
MGGDWYPHDLCPPFVEGGQWGMGGGLNLDHCTLNHPKINAAQKIDEICARGHNCSAALDLRKNEQVVGEGATVFPNTAGQR